MSAADIDISFGANTAGIQQAVADIHQSVNQTTVGITQSFSTGNKTITETRNKFVTINNAIDDAKRKWTDWAEKTATIRNSFRIAQEVVSRLSVPLQDGRLSTVFSDSADVKTWTTAFQYKETRINAGFRNGGRGRTRTCDPSNVNAVL